MKKVILVYKFYYYDHLGEASTINVGYTSWAYITFIKIVVVALYKIVTFFKSNYIDNTNLFVSLAGYLINPRSQHPCTTNRQRLPGN